MLPVLEVFTISYSYHEGNHLMKIPLRKIRELTCLLLILTSAVTLLSFLPRARAGIEIYSVAPSSGIVGTAVQLSSNLTTSGGVYEIRFDDAFLTNGTATGNYVNASFTVPFASAGNHTLKVVDVATEENANITFAVATAYDLKIDVPVSPTQLQEGDPVPITVNITGGQASTTYVANLTVLAPNNASYVNMLGVSTSTVGSGVSTINYPDAFSVGANTNFVGDYGIYFNSTQSVKTFHVGLTNSTEYHRTQTVDIKSSAYQPSENVTLAISGNAVNYAVNLTADSGGIIHFANWTVPANASRGTYNVNVVSTSGSPTTKNPADTQNFTVPGYVLNVTARNLANDPVPSVDIRASENGTSVENATTSSTGSAILRLEFGNFTCQGYFKGEKVGETTLEVIGDASADLTCNLTNLQIRVVTVVNGTEIGIPETSVYLTPDNLTLTTDITGTVIVHSLLPNVTYALNASRYGTPFNETTTLPQLFVNDTLVARYNVTIVCPTLTLQVQVFKANSQPLSNARVRAQESLGGLHYEGITDADGMVALDSAFGRYAITVYDSNGIKLNETNVDLFQNQNITVYCSLYGLTVAVQVLDYFSQPIPNANVTMQKEGFEPLSNKTQGDGIATFDNVIGGDFEISVYLVDQFQPTVVQGTTIENSTTVQIKIDKYVLLAGLLMETSQLAIAIMIVLTVVLIIGLEIYRIRRHKPQKVESQSVNKESQGKKFI